MPSGIFREGARAVTTAGRDVDAVVVAFELVELPLVVVGTELLLVVATELLVAAREVELLLLSTTGTGLVVDGTGGTSVESWYMEAHSARLNC